MLVCHCFVVRAREVREAIAGGARSAGEVRRACRAGAGCGGCQPLIEELLEEHACGVSSELMRGDACAPQGAPIRA